MNRENILFAAVGLLLGYVIAFHLVVHVNQSQPPPVAPAGSPSVEGMAADQPGAPAADPEEKQRLLAAAEEAARAARQDPQNFEAQMRAAEGYFAAGSFEDSIDFMTRANRLRPDDYDTVVKLGNVYSSAGRFEDAAQWYTAALAKKPNDCDARSELALTYYMRKPSQPERAVAELRRCLETDPAHVPSLHNLSLLLLEMKQYAESESVLARLEKADPSYDQLPRLRDELAKARGGASGAPADTSGSQKRAPTD